MHVYKNYYQLIGNTILFKIINTTFWPLFYFWISYMFIFVFLWENCNSSKKTATAPIFNYHLKVRRRCRCCVFSAEAISNQEDVLPTTFKLADVVNVCSSLVGVLKHSLNLLQKQKALAKLAQPVQNGNRRKVHF